MGAVSNLIFDDSGLIGSNGRYEDLLAVFGDVRTLMPIDIDPFLVLHIVEAFTYIHLRAVRGLIPP